ncbi:MAG: hypothetical protein SOZ80_04745 [Prevotella sp.]|uniref:tetratricopeptide repeat protein n=1 Tax=Prevotella sp. TaxID=59823 RepID=UPI002A2C99F2|nr:hypothetical protein [Prevotella sp.]MDD7319201.1 hypothetical protein [Prevotellaceae bacterium]MDY4020069.1 hypothetical protein [Prevotella sp.]
MTHTFRVILTLLAFTFPTFSQAQKADKNEATEKLGMAIDYFTAGKYHEALLIFSRLDKEFKLNPRFHAYMGVCQYYEWNFPEATKLLSEAIPLLGGLAPHERSVYYYACAESFFNQEKYAEAIPYYEQHLNVCYDNEKGDSLYRIAFCHLFGEDEATACEYFESSLAYYEQYNSSATARIAQLKNMINGLKSN